MTTVEKTWTVLQLRPADVDGAFRRVGEPVCGGLPFPRGLVAREELIRLVADSQLIPLQTTVTERWSDGSIKWALLEFLATTDPAGCAECRLEVLSSLESARHPRAIRIDENSAGLTMEAGKVRAAFGGNEGQPVRLAPVTSSPPPWSTIAVEVDDGSGRVVRPVFHEVVVEHAGPLTARVRMSGTLSLPASRRSLNFVLRVQLFEGLPAVSVSLTVHNSARARHNGGIWELGDPGSVFLRDVSVRLTLPSNDRARDLRYWERPGAPECRAKASLRIYQDSSGGDHWDSRTHLTRDGVVGPAFRGYEVNADGATQPGRRATPVVQLTSETRSIAVAMAHFWENFPKALEADARAITLGLFPGASRSLHEIQGGERKRHDFTLCVSADPVTDEPLAWARSPLVVSAPSEWYLACDALPLMAPFNADPGSERLVQAGLEGPASFESKREQVDEFGWRNFGEIYADHEAVNDSGTLISHYNNQYDAVAGFGRQFFRTGDARWFAHMASLARHVADIDIYHTTEDKAAYNGGLFWHTFHYVDAGQSSHRSYPTSPGVSGGGPSSEHNYAGGLALHYLLTGDSDSRDAVMRLAEWVVAMDDGRQNIFGWLDRGPTGWASATGSLWYHGPGRGAGNSISTLLTASRFSPDPKFLRKAEELIRRCIHPADDPSSLELLDAERRWSYTVFLQAVGRYLSYKHERNELDEHYAYARASLLTYARWMARNEYPFLDKPEALEYPNETWAAQDLRKSEVFVLAWLCTRGEDREPMRERAEFFFERSIRTLQSMPTRTLSRPQVLLLSYVDGVPWMRANPEASLPEPESEMSRWGSASAPFVPQRVRAVKRAKIIGGALTAGAILGLLGAYLW